MLSKKFYDVPVFLWVILLGLIAYLLYKKFYKPENMSNSSTEQTTTTQPKSDDIKLYNFNTSWCGHSLRFQEEWNKFSNEISKKNNVVPVKVYDIKCDNKDNESMCVDYEVPGYPTVIIEKNGAREVYNGPRTADALMETIEKKL
jgi:hypothetical protein